MADKITTMMTTIKKAAMTPTTMMTTNKKTTAMPLTRMMTLTIRRRRRRWRSKINNA